jgi:hypothetical protein
MKIQLSDTVVSLFSTKNHAGDQPVAPLHATVSIDAARGVDQRRQGFK